MEKFGSEIQDKHPGSATLSCNIPPNNKILEKPGVTYLGAPFQEPEALFVSFKLWKKRFAITCTQSFRHVLRERKITN
jgi:hypothetical protein